MTTTITGIIIEMNIHYALVLIPHKSHMCRVKIRVLVSLYAIVMRKHNTLYWVLFRILSRTLRGYEFAHFASMCSSAIKEAQKQKRLSEQVYIDKCCFGIAWLHLASSLVKLYNITEVQKCHYHFRTVFSSIFRIILLRFESKSNMWSCSRVETHNFLFTTKEHIGDSNIWVIYKSGCSLCYICLYLCML